MGKPLATSRRGRGDDPRANPRAGNGELRKAARSFDFVFCTVPSDLPWDEYIAALRPQGKLCIFGIPEQPVVFRAFGLIGPVRSRSSAARRGR